MRKVWQLVLICGLSLALVLPAWANDWPSPLRDSSNRNSVNEQPVPPLTKIGEVQNQLISPVVEGNILIVADSDADGQKIVAYRLSTLTKLWEYHLGVFFPRQPVIYRGNIYFGVFSQPYLYSVSLLTGEYNWQVALQDDTQSIKFAPLGFEDSILVVGKVLHSLNLAFGQENWQLPIIIDSPLGADDRYVYARRHDQRISQIEARTGQVSWSIDTNTTFGTAPLVVGSTIYVGTYYKILAIDQASGIKRWEYPTAGPLIGALAATGDRVIYSTNEGDITALDETGRKLWSHQFNSVVNGWRPDFLVAGDSVLAQADPSRNAILSALTGEQIYSGQLADSGVKFKAISDKVVIALTENSAVIYQANDWLTGTLGDPAVEKRIDPVIVVPGMLESWPVLGVWQLDPVFKTFDNLLNTFRAGGYTDGLTLFTFPYDWHRDNAETAKLLAQKVAEVRTLTGATQVDIIAHSMGGLVTRAYIQSDSYRDDVDQFIALAVPNHGSVKSYLTWEAGETGLGAVEGLKERLLSYEAVKQGYTSNKVSYIRERVPSIGQVLPAFSYLVRANQLVPYFPCNQALYPCNPFLESLNSQVGKLISRVSVLNVVAQLKTKTTLERLSVTTAAIDGLWEHGMPSNYPSEEGMTNGSGDVTVLTHSAHLDGVPEKIITTDHNLVVTDAASLVLKELSDRNVVIEAKTPPLRYLFVRLFSPVTLLLTDKDGHQTGTDPVNGELVNTIPNAHYSGHTAEGEYVIIADPTADSYSLSLSGVAAGPYKVTASLIEADQTVEATQSGETLAKQLDHYELEVKAQSVSLAPQASPTPCVSSPEVTIRAP